MGGSRSCVLPKWSPTGKSVVPENETHLRPWQPRRFDWKTPGFGGSSAP
jgi:hypothetical protein